MARTATIAGALWALSVTVPDASAQDPADAGAVRVRTTVERPPEGSLRRGTVPVPSWGIWVCASVVVAGAALGLALRIGLSKR